MAKRKILQVLLVVILAAVCLFALAPIVLMLLNSFKTSQELAGNAWGIPQVWTVGNYSDLINYNSGVMLRAYGNSIYISVTYTVLTLLVSSLAAYAFSKFSFKGQSVIFMLMLVTMMIPSEITLPAIYLMFSQVRMLNTYTIQILPGIASAFALFMLRQFMDSVPDSLIEASLLDGAGYTRIYWKIMLPLVKPALGALAVLTFLAKWNDYLWPSMLLTKKEVMPIMVLLPTLNVENSVYAIPWNLIMAGCTIVTLPLIIVFLIFQNQFMSSVTIGAVKE